MRLRVVWTGLRAKSVFETHLGKETSTYSIKLPQKKANNMKANSFVKRV